MFLCGSLDEKEDQKESSGSPCPTPKRTKKSTSFCKINILGKDNSNKNPYADRGLDKFYALLADLDDKKQSIYTQKGSEDISFVRFVYTDDSNRIKPIVVKAKEKKQEKSGSGLVSKQSTFKSSTSSINQDEAIVATHAASQSTAEVAPPKGEPGEKPRRKRRGLRCKGSFKLDDFKKPLFYYVVIVFLILLFLSMYGRSFAILCLTIVWYVCPIIVGGNSSSSSSSSSKSLPTERKPKRKEYERKQSVGKKINVGPSSPKSVISGLIEVK